MKRATIICRASGDQIRSGAEKAQVQAVFDVSGVAGPALLMEEHGVAAPEDAILIMGREIARTGKNICRINGQVVTLSLYRKIGGLLADLHAQFEHTSLLAHEKQRSLLDRFGGQEVLDALNEVDLLYLRWREARHKFEKLSSDEGERARRVDMLRYQIGEILQADLKPGEDEDLDAEKIVLANAEKISLLAAQAYSVLYEMSGGQSSAVDLLAMAVESLKSLTSLDCRLETVLASLENVLYQAEDAARELACYRDEVEYNPDRLGVVEERLELIRRLKKKYGATLPRVQKYLQSAQNELKNLENTDEFLESSAKELVALEDAYKRSAGVLSAARGRAAKSLERAVAGELLSLEMGRVEFRVAFSQVAGPAPGGNERVEFLISPNPGEPLKPLSKIASGGELTRIMLALKALLAGADEIPVLVFDEADTGIGGQALQAVAEKMAQLGESLQVIGVTHSAQVASHAKTHHRIVKEFDGGRTVIRVETLDLQERLEELARMLGGKEVTDITRRHAAEMLHMASKKI